MLKDKRKEKKPEKDPILFNKIAPNIRGLELKEVIKNILVNFKIKDKGKKIRAKKILVLKFSIR